MINYYLKFTYHPLQNPPPFISTELKKKDLTVHKPYKTLINSIVLSRLDYYSSLLNILSAKDTSSCSTKSAYSFLNTYYLLYNTTVPLYYNILSNISYVDTLLPQV